MTRAWPALALAAAAAALAGVVAVLLLTAPAPTTAERSEQLAAELRCPDCEGLSVADSPTQAAREIRRQIEELLASGASDDEVRAHFVARYGEWIRLAPSSPAVWVVPFAVVVAGGVALAVWLSRRPETAEPARGRATLSEEERARLREEAEALDA